MSPASYLTAPPRGGTKNVARPTWYTATSRWLGYAPGMATQKQRAAAKKNVKKAQAGAQKKQTLKNMPKKTKTALGKEANKVRKGEAKTRDELNQDARRLNISGRSKMGKDELRRAIARAK
jgi:hypothetical protein